MSNQVKRQSGKTGLFSRLVSGSEVFNLFIALAILLLAAGVPTAAVAQVEIEELDYVWANISAEDSGFEEDFFFECLLEGTGFESARLRAPSGLWYDLEYEGGEEWIFNKVKASLEELESEFGPGEYLVRITHDGGEMDLTVQVTGDLEMPNAIPAVLAPEREQPNVVLPATMIWETVAEPNFSLINSWLEDEMADKLVFHTELTIENGMPDRIELSGLLPGRLYYGNCAFINYEVGVTSGDLEVEYTELRGTGTGVMFRTGSLAIDSGDFTGDGTGDLAVFRPATGLWAVRGVTRAYFGSSDDLPVPGDYTGDGTDNIAVFRPATGLWAVRGGSREYFGGVGDVPVPGDYNADGTTNVGIFRPASGLWAVRGVTRAYFGGTEDIPVPGYYEPGGEKVAGIFRPSSGLWAIRGLTRAYFGSARDVPVPGDYDGNGLWGPAIFRLDSGLWAIRGVTRTYFGEYSDQPIPGRYGDDGKDYPGIFRPMSGLWAVRAVTRTYFGSEQDIPVTR